MTHYRVLTWQIHGNYLYYLAQAQAEFYVPVKPGRPERYGGRMGSSWFPPNVHDVPAGLVCKQDFDVILYQTEANWLEDQFEILSPAQQSLPRIYLEHDPPRQSPTDTRHVVDDTNVLLVHCTHFNRLMWDSGRTPTRVIEHGVLVPDEIRYEGTLERGLVVVNGLQRRGRRLGADVFEQVRKAGIPLDLVGMFSEEMGGLGEVEHTRLPAYEAQYRFFFNPIRYTSLGLAVLEAMMIGLPIVGLATTEMVSAVQNGVNGFVHTDPDYLVAAMAELLQDRDEAKRLSEGARRIARERFNIRRFTADWERAFALVAGQASRAWPAPELRGLNPLASLTR